MTRLSSWDQWLALRRCHHHHLSNPRMSEHGGLSSKVKCQMLSILSYREEPSAALGARRPCFLAVDGKTPLLSLFCFGVWWLSWLHCDDHNTHPLFILYLTEARSSANYDSVFDCKARFCFHIYQSEFTGNIYPIYPKDCSSSRRYTRSFLNYT